MQPAVRLPFAQHAQELHFYSTQHFANTFRRIIGKYPKDFRLTAKADQDLDDI